MASLEPGTNLASTGVARLRLRVLAFARVPYQHLAAGGQKARQHGCHTLQQHTVLAAEIVEADRFRRQ